MLYPYPPKHSRLTGFLLHWLLLPFRQNQPIRGDAKIKMSPQSATSDAPVELLDLASRRVRREYTPAAVRIFFNIIEEWNVGPEDARRLVGDISTRYYRELKAKQEGRILSSDRLQRISCLIGIYKTLRILYGEDLGNRFVHLPNSNRLFSSSTPLSYMIQGGLPAMQKVRRLLDARKEGP